MNRGWRDTMVRIVAGLLSLGGFVAAVRGDDVAVDDQAGPHPGLSVPSLQVAAADLGQVFDSIVFGGGLAEEEPAAGGTADAVAERLAPVRRRAESRIATIDRIVGLSAAQRHTLEVAAGSDLRRLSDAISQARGRHAGRTLKMDQQVGSWSAEAQQELQQAQDDAQRCRELVRAACGPTSLLGKVVVGTLDEDQARRYAAVMDGRSRCRWQAVVAAGLDQLDGSLGLTQRQHDTVMALLMADVPPLEEDPQPTALPAAAQVAQRLGGLGEEKLGAILDPRQRAVIAHGGAFPGAAMDVPLQALPAMPLVPR